MRVDFPKESLDVAGFAYFSDVLSVAEERELVRRIDEDAARWEQDFGRRALRYGFRYHYDSHTLSRLEALPDWLRDWAVHFRDVGWMPAVADQSTIQEYAPGVGISDHIDDCKCFGPSIVTISLLSSCAYRLTNLKLDRKIELYVQPRSAVLLSGDARVIWKHGIPARKADPVDGERLQRSRRLSITFRTAKLDRVQA